MPDIAMCPSTVCSVRKQCARNWDSGVYVADRPYKEQTWIPVHDMKGVGYSEPAKPEDCSWYMSLGNPVAVCNPQPSTGVDHEQ